MTDFYFDGNWRMDWGFGNPNITATLIAMLMILSWAFVGVRKYGFWIGLTCFTGLGICLIHTFSRGGIIALLTGLLPVALAAYLYQGWITRKRILGLVVGLLILGGVTLGLNAHQRYSQGIVEQDRSISNRLDIWKVTPQMMQDAPGGWGFGNASKAFQEWYQDTNRTERYRNLVSMHLNWLVEMGWPMRFLYLAGWVFCFGLCITNRPSPELWIPLGIWMAFAAAGVFTMVGDNFWIWIVPCLTLIAVVVIRFMTKDALFRWHFLTPPIAATLGLLAIYCYPPLETKISLHHRDGVTVMGTSSSSKLIVADKKTFGEAPGRALRSYQQKSRVRLSVAVVKEDGDIPSGFDGVVYLDGSMTPDRLKNVLPKLKEANHIYVINPTFAPAQLELPENSSVPITVYFGEFFSNGSVDSWKAANIAMVQLIPGIGGYLPNWPEYFNL